jgi:hypothetical protein
MSIGAGFRENAGAPAYPCSGQILLGVDPGDGLAVPRGEHS